VDENEIDRLAADLKSQLRRGTGLIRAGNGNIGPAALIGLAAAAENDLGSRLSHHELEGEQQHDHDDFESLVIELGEIADRNRLEERVAATICEHDILRVKGFVAVRNAPARLLVQAVGPRLSTYFDRPWRAGEAQRSDIVVIGLRGLDRAGIRASLAG